MMITNFCLGDALGGEPVVARLCCESVIGTPIKGVAIGVRLTDKTWEASGRKLDPKGQTVMLHEGGFSQVSADWYPDVGTATRALSNLLYAEGLKIHDNKKRIVRM